MYLPIHSKSINLSRGLNDYMNDIHNQDGQPVRSGRSWALMQSDTEQTIPVQGPTLTIGRFPDNDLVLETPSSSNFHAVIIEGDDGIWYITDRHSSNGTLLNTIRLKSGHCHPLHYGDRLKFTKSFESAPVFTVVPAPDDSIAHDPRPAPVLTQSVGASDSDDGSVDFAADADGRTGRPAAVPDSDEHPLDLPAVVGGDRRTGPDGVVIEERLTRSPVIADSHADRGDDGANHSAGEASGHVDHDGDSRDVVDLTGSPERKRRREDPRPNLGKVDDYRCVICGELPLAMAEEECDLDLVQVVPCRHHFHRGCINIWLETRAAQPTCPSCRTRVDRVETLLLIHQHASLLRQERQYEIELQIGDSSANGISESIEAYLEAFRRFKDSRSTAERFDARMLAHLNTAGTTALARLSGLAATPQLMLQAIGDILEGVFDGDDDLASLYEVGALPAAVLALLGQLGVLWVQTALSYDTPVDPQSFQQLLRDVSLPPSLRDLINASSRPWSDSDLQSCLRGDTTPSASIREPEPIARKRFEILLDQNLKSDAANYAASQGLHAESCLIWAQMRQIDLLTDPGRITSLSWTHRAQVMAALQDVVGSSSDDFVFRFTRTVFDTDRVPAGPVPPTDTSHVVALLVAYLRSAPRHDLKHSLANCSKFLSCMMKVDMMYGVLEQLVSINPTAASFLACDIASLLAPTIKSRSDDRLDLASVCNTDSQHDGLSLDRVLQLIITIVSSHGDLQRQQSLVDVLCRVPPRPSLILSLTKRFMKVGVRGHPLAWQLLRSADLSRFTSTEITHISNIAQQLEAGGVTAQDSAPEFYLALFKRRPSRANFNRFSDQAVVRDAVEWLRAIPPSDHSLESVSILIDNVGDDQQIADIVKECVLHETFPFVQDPRFYCHLIANSNVQAWLMKVPSAVGTKVITICGQLMASSVLLGDGNAGSGLPKLIDDAPEALSARIYECACRMALEQYHDGKITSRSKRNLIRPWIHRLRSLCLVSDSKARWTGFQNTSMRTLKPTDPLYRELRSAGLFNAIV